MASSIVPSDRKSLCLRARDTPLLHAALLYIYAAGRMLIRFTERTHASGRRAGMCHSQACFHMLLKALEMRGSKPR